MDTLSSKTLPSSISRTSAGSLLFTVPLRQGSAGGAVTSERRAMSQSATTSLPCGSFVRPLVAYDVVPLPLPAHPLPLPVGVRLEAPSGPLEGLADARVGRDPLGPGLQLPAPHWRGKEAVPRRAGGEVHVQACSSSLTGPMKYSSSLASPSVEVSIPETMAVK